MEYIITDKEIANTLGKAALLLSEASLELEGVLGQTDKDLEPILKKVDDAILETRAMFLSHLKDGMDDLIRFYLEGGER